MPSRLTSAACLLFSLLLSLLARAEPSMPAEEQDRFRALLPDAFKKLSERRVLHVAFVGDPLLLADKDPNSMVQSFLRQLGATFFYTGGVYEIYDPKHLEERRPKILYETCPTSDDADPGVFQLMQYMTTLGLLNDPDLLILCAGPGDASAGLDLTTAMRAFDRMHALAKSKGSETIVLGPRAFTFTDNDVDLQLGTRIQSVTLAQWARERNVPYHDPNPQLFPASVLFHPNDDAQTVWNAFLRESVEWIQGQDKRPAIASRRQQAVGKALFKTLTTTPRTPYFQSGTKAGQTLTVTLSNMSKLKLGGLIVPSLLGQRDGIRFQSNNRAPSFQLQPPTELSHTYRGLLPLSLIVINDRRVEWLDVMAPLSSVGLEWQEHALHNNNGPVPMQATLYPYAGAPERVPYTITFGKERAKGTATFANGRPAVIKRTVTLPKDIKTRTFRETLVIQLGENGSLGTFTRQLDAIRQFPLATKVPLQRVLAGNGTVPQNVDPLVVGEPEASLTVEASKTDLSINVDLRNLSLAANEGAPAIQLDLSIDARSYEERQTIGYTGVLFITAGPEDGPAAVSPFAKRAHFGNGYAMRPLVLGRRARLSTRPNGDRRLTVRMTKDYFYLHHWQIGNRNSQLGLGLSLSIAQPGEADPLHYVLQETPRYPNNAEDLTIVELWEDRSNRWCVKWHP